MVKKREWETQELRSPISWRKTPKTTARQKQASENYNQREFYSSEKKHLMKTGTLGKDSGKDTELITLSSVFQQHSVAVSTSNLLRLPSSSVLKYEERCNEIEFAAFPLDTNMKTTMPKVFAKQLETETLSECAFHRKVKSSSKQRSHEGSPGASASASKATTSSSLKSPPFPHQAMVALSGYPSKQLVLSTLAPPTQAANRMTSWQKFTTPSAKNKKYGSRYSCSSVRGPKFMMLPTLGTTSLITLLTLICIETVLLSTMSSCAKTFYMHWNTSNSIFRIDNTDHIIDVNKGNLAFEFDQVHIICPVYEPGTFENETEKYIIYNVSKVEYETCRITNADPRVIAICDKPQKLMFFTITFRPFTPQPGGLEFLPGNDYYFISTSSKDDLYRRIGGRCSTNNMKVVFKVCCANEEKNKTVPSTTMVATSGSVGGSEISRNAPIGGGGTISGLKNPPGNSDANIPSSANHGHGHVHHLGTLNVNMNSIGVNGVHTSTIPGVGGVLSGNSGVQLKPISNLGNSINTNIDQFNRVPNIIGAGSVGIGGHGSGSGIMLSPGHGSINMLPPLRGGVNIGQYPGHHHIQNGIRINNVPTQQNYPPLKGNSNINNNGNEDPHHYDKHPNEVVKNEELTYNSGAKSNRLKSIVVVSEWSNLFSFSTITAHNTFLPCLENFGGQLANIFGTLTSSLHPMALVGMVMVIAFHYLLCQATIAFSFKLESTDNKLLMSCIKKAVVGNENKKSLSGTK